MFIKHLQKLLTPTLFLKIVYLVQLFKWQYSGYGIGFNSKGEFTHPDGEDSKNVIIFGADVSNSSHSTNNTQSVLVLGHGLTQKINDTLIYAEKCIRLILLLITKCFA